MWNAPESSQNRHSQAFVGSILGPINYPPQRGLFSWDAQRGLFSWDAKAQWTRAPPIFYWNLESKVCLFRGCGQRLAVVITHHSGAAISEFCNMTRLCLQRRYKIVAFRYHFVTSFQQATSPLLQGPKYPKAYMLVGFEPTRVGPTVE